MNFGFKEDVIAGLEPAIQGRRHGYPWPLDARVRPAHDTGLGTKCQNQNNRSFASSV